MDYQSVAVTVIAEDQVIPCQRCTHDGNRKAAVITVPSQPHPYLRYLLIFIIYLISAFRDSEKYII